MCLMIELWQDHSSYKETAIYTSLTQNTVVGTIISGTAHPNLVLP